MKENTPHRMQKQVAPSATLPLVSRSVCGCAKQHFSCTFWIMKNPKSEAESWAHSKQGYPIHCVLESFPKHPLLATIRGEKG